MSRVQLWGYHCDRCGHEWLPRKSEDGQPLPEPRVCPKCKNPYWNIPRKPGKPTLTQDAQDEAQF